MSRFLKLLLILGTTALIFVSSNQSIWAAFSFRFNPTAGYVAKGNQFTVDILIDTGGEDIVKARSVITFDPTRLRVVKAEYNNSLFAQYPATEQSTDNTNGVVMLSGFTQSGSGTLYATEGEPDVFARVTFQALKAGVATIDWEHSGTDQAFKSVIIQDGSPPQNVLASKPVAANFTVQDSTTTPPPPSTPNTGLEDYSQLIIGGGVLLGAVLVLSGTGVLFRAGNMLFSKREGTIVEYE